MKFVGFDDDYIIPEGIPESQVRLAIGNTVCTYLAEAIGRSLIKSITDGLYSDDGLIPPDGSNPEDPSGPIGGNRTDTSKSDEGRDVKQADVEPAFIPDGIRGNESQVEKVIPELTLPVLQYQPHHEEDHTDDRPRVEVIYNRSKIISSVDLLKMDFEVFPFGGDWYGFLGTPSSSFQMSVFGKAGQGKSTYSVQVANYLASNFGSAIYVSGEEGFCLTFQKKFRDHGAASLHLDVADIRTYSELVKSIEPGRYRFIILDSFDTLKIIAEQLRELKLRYKDCAFITISQVTKSGDARGSYQVMHDSDIIVEVISGKAITIKNRFLSTGKIYPVFR